MWMLFLFYLLVLKNICSFHNIERYWAVFLKLHVAVSFFICVKVDKILSTEKNVDFDNGYVGQRYRLYISSRVMSLLSLAFSIIHGLKPDKEKKRYGGIF